MCDLRIGGWSLPGVMSDWLLAKYCRCRLRLDWCWCRWTTSVKSRGWWGLQVWRRLVGLVRGTWWSAGSSADCMVARTARRSGVQFLGWASKPRLSRDFVGAKSWVVIGGGYTEFAGFLVVHQKIIGFLGWSTKPRPKIGGSNTSPVWPVCNDTFRRPKRRTRVGIARLASRLSKFAVVEHPSDGATTKFPKRPFGGVYPSLI
jgi:hypothetical protein